MDQLVRNRRQLVRQIFVNPRTLPPSVLQRNTCTSAYFPFSRQKLRWLFPLHLPLHPEQMWMFEMIKMTYKDSGLLLLCQGRYVMVAAMFCRTFWVNYFLLVIPGGLGIKKNKGKPQRSPRNCASCVRLVTLRSSCWIL